ncbi:hypothetical protein GKIL_0695 [Gloeobacter kilaueensis JS1]|uniref:Uncharacterized protein n=1 Tax=Gloeobacter kilaueensis (strain ATCC BAA-2537 / CCAP 1431/1 / ULC 316 / JS1) TaxID=1183438 RepID=U5QDH6_GLOK1|nr:hypothetical protein GKIL_0695 [Gloeobacter kilaueensis JS1]
MEPNRQAGHLPPEFESAAGEVLVRFLPTGYVPPSRIGHDLSPLQQRLLEVLAVTGSASLSTIRTHLDPPVPERTVQENLQLLRRLELVGSSGKGRGARWLLNATT